MPAAEEPPEAHGFVPSIIDAEEQERFRGLEAQAVHEFTEICSKHDDRPGAIPRGWQEPGQAIVAQCFLAEDAPAGATEVKLAFVRRGPGQHVQSLHGRRLRLQFASTWTTESICAWDNEASRSPARCKCQARRS
jgi:hypothetical protein